MANNDDDEEFIKGLIIAGFVVIVAGGMYKLLKAIGSYNSGTVISYDKVADLKPKISHTYESNTFSCKFHSTTAICPRCKKDCLKCNPSDYTKGVCVDCGEDDRITDDWYDDDF